MPRQQTKNDTDYRATAFIVLCLHCVTRQIARSWEHNNPKQPSCIFVHMHWLAWRPGGRPFTHHYVAGSVLERQQRLVKRGRLQTLPAPVWQRQQTHLWQHHSRRLSAAHLCRANSQRVREQVNHFAPKGHGWVEGGRMMSHHLLRAQFACKCTFLHAHVQTHWAHILH